MSPKSSFRFSFKAIAERGSCLQQEPILQLPSIHALATLRDGRERIPSLSSALIIIVVLIRSCSVVHHVQIVFLQYTVGYDMTTEPSHVIPFPSGAGAGLNC